MLYSAELRAYMVGRGGVEPPFSDFQSGTPTVYVICPYVWREVRESNSRLQFCRLAYEPLYELPICMVGTLRIELRLAVPQTAVLAIILRTPYVWRQSEVSIPIRLTPDP